MTKLSRRDFVKNVSAAGAAAGIFPALGGMAARAADVSGYKALVCVFFKGGMDHYDTVLPYDNPSYDRIAEIRQELFNAYQRREGGSTRVRSALMPLEPANAADFGARRFALPPELAGVHDLFTRGRAAIVGNVGPLVETLTRETFRNRSGRRPARLFSHNDQQSTWMSLAPEGERFGWGGRFADAALASSANVNPTFTAISVTGNDVFLTGEQATQYQINGGRPQDPEILRRNSLFGTARNSDVARAVMRDHLRADGALINNLFARDVTSIARRAIDSNTLFGEALETAPTFTTPFPDSRLGGQLRTVAETIAVRGALGANRQVFFASTGGFDTHARQWNSLPNLHAQFDAAVVAFNAAMEELGMENDVTLFTASDFGRTLVNNDDGSDHGWGAHHFVVGGAVDGGRIFGDIPPADVEHTLDAGRGRLIPTTSVEQFAAPLGRWFGLNPAEIDAALPGLATFGGEPTFV
ncbi:MAG: DUF1501 domain-containing protein [Parvularculaceae bacterium]